MFKLGWQEGQARIVARELHDGMVRSGINFYATSEYETVFDYVADVEPAGGGMPFRATFTELFKSNLERQPEVGDLVAVKFDPKNQEVKFDHRPLEEEAQAAQAAKQERFAAISQGLSPTVEPAQPAQPAVTPGLTTDAELAAADKAFQAALAEGQSAVAAFLRAKTAGDRGEANRLKATVASTNAAVQAANAEFQRLIASRPDWRSGRYPAAAAPAGDSDPLERLGKLADLHDRGVLTDAEFASEKAKILSEG